ncbi:hypothetical protein D3C85_1822220 [compost metagenome]
MTLGEFRADVSYLEALGKHIISLGYEVSIADVVENGDGYIKWANQRKLAVTQE